LGPQLLRWVKKYIGVMRTWDTAYPGRILGWGFALEFYPKEPALTITFIRWYFIIEKDYS
jgi:hypothetical protein